METPKNILLILHYIRRFISRLLSLVSLKDIVLSLLLLLCGLSSLTVQLSGSTTSIHLWGPRRRRHSRPALVLLHGFGGFAKWQFERQIAPLSRHFDLYLPDLVFFGQSVSAEGKRSVKFQAECVAEAMRKLGVGKYTVAGVSYGGFVAFCMAAAAAEREVERVVVIASGVATSAKERKELAEKEGREVAELLKKKNVLLHGFGGFAKWQFERQIASLSRQFDLYLPDLVFFGHSVSAEGKRSVKFQAECVAEAMRKLGVEKYTVAGVSYGGFVAFCMAAVAAEREVERVVVIASGLAATAKERKDLAEKEGREVAELLLPERVEDLRNLFRRCMFRPPTWLPDFLLRDFIEIMFKDHRKERTELLNELLSNGVGWGGALPIPKQETLILWGDEDTIFPLPLAYALKRHLGDKAKLQVIKEAGHALPLEKPHHVNSSIRRFILQEKLV
ncbi:hypothetical protein MA16_Dca021645 [Dendrobium catenatum]|uniref:AB hydrolase-1 domain-containing protein n=1 Tax=Dendrobium catenatum TaxID=906689 RepID=A0A2I0WEZ4_9ASPA|nr:hypothetical protein MA16_Dca021645 [Dendrobium catenatum]